MESITPPRLTRRHIVSILPERGMLLKLGGSASETTVANSDRDNYLQLQLFRRLTLQFPPSSRIGILAAIAMVA